LLDAMRELERLFARTADSWRDETREVFEHDYLADFGPAIKAAANSILELNNLLRQTIHECS
jgi:hypothetical protein